MTRRTCLLAAFSLTIVRPFASRGDTSTASMSSVILSPTGEGLFRTGEGLFRTGEGLFRTEDESARDKKGVSRTRGESARIKDGLFESNLPRSRTRTETCLAQARDVRGDEARDPRMLTSECTS